MTHEELYAQLRAEILARHFCLSRYTRADLFDGEAFIGTRTKAAEDAHNASPGGITWEIPKNPKTKRKLYVNAIGLRRKLRTGALPEHERWRWAKHDRTNALIQTGVRMISLAIDLQLGDKFALQVLERVVNGLEALFHFRNGPSPFEGYMVRWDVVASDLWETKRGAMRQEKLVQNLEFLLNADTKSFEGGDHYLYCTPLDDPRYIEAIERHDGWQRGKDRYRRWEPSMDEYVGILAGYFMLWKTLREENDEFRASLTPPQRERVDALLGRVRSQVRRIGRYLKATGFCLVRPNKGFTFRGALDMNPVFEYPVARVCHRITGDPMTDFLPESEATFEQAVDMAGQGQELRELTAEITVQMGMNIEAIMEQQGLMPSNQYWRDLVRVVLELAANAVPLPIPIVDLVAAAQFQRHIDVVGELEERKPAGALHYLMNWVARNTPDPQGIGQGSLNLFRTVFPKLIPHSPVTDWAPLAGITALDDSNTIVRDTYAEWYGQLRSLEAFDPVATQQPDTPAARFDARSEIDLGRLRAGFTIFANAVRFLLGPSSDRASELREQLDTMRRAIENVHDGKLVIGDYRQPGGPAPAVGEQHDSSRLMFGYMLPLSLCWSHAARGGTPAVLNEPLPTAGTMRLWPTPEVPASVVMASRKPGTHFQFPFRSIMRGRLPLGATVYPLFKNPPPRPLDEDLGPPPPPLPADAFSVPEQGTWTDGWPFVLPGPGSGTPVRRVVREFRRAIPPLPPPFDSEHYQAIFSETKVDVQKADWTTRIENGEYIVVARFWQRTLIPLDLNDDRRFKIDVEIKWVRRTPD